MRKRPVWSARSWARFCSFVIEVLLKREDLASRCVACSRLCIRFADVRYFAGGIAVKRPAGITVLAILIFCGAALCAVVGILSFAGGAFIANNIQNPALERFALSGGAFLGVYALCFAGVYGITGP